MNLRHRRTLAMLPLLAGWGLCAALPAAGEPPLEYQLQAAYVSKFLRFVDWPAESGADTDFVVGIVGGPEFRGAMDALDGFEVGDRSVSVRHVDAPDGIPGIHVLVLGPLSRTLPYLEAAREAPILTVGAADDFVQAGGIIQFVLVEDTMRFDVNLAAAERAGLKVSSRLLRLARNVRR